MKSEQTAALEADLDAKKKLIVDLTRKIEELDARISKASFEKKPALREEVAQSRTELEWTKADVLKMEKLILPRSNELDARAATIAAFRDFDARSVGSAEEAIAAVKIAIRKLSEACELGRAAAELSRELGGAPCGYVQNPRAISGIDRLFFERFYVGAEVRHFYDVRFPTLIVNVDAPATRSLLAGGLITGEERTRHETADAELAARGK